MYGIMVLKLVLEHKEETLTFSHQGIIVIYHADAVLSIQKCITVCDLLAIKFRPGSIMLFL